MKHSNRGTFQDFTVCGNTKTNFILTAVFYEHWWMRNMLSWNDFWRNKITVKGVNLNKYHKFGTASFLKKIEFTIGRTSKDMFFSRFLSAAKGFTFWICLCAWCFRTDIFRFTATATRAAMTASVNLHLRTFEPRNQNNALLPLRTVTYSVTDEDTHWRRCWPVMIVRWTASAVAVVDPRHARGCDEWRQGSFCR